MRVPRKVRRLAGFLYYLGFALPLSVAFDLRKNGKRDAHPGPGRCSRCKRMKRETYVLGMADRICRDDLADTVNVQAWPRGPMVRVVESIEEKPAENARELSRFDYWWDRQFP